MLVLTRKPTQSVQIGDEIVVNVIRVRGNTIQLGIQAPKSIPIVRSELLVADADEKNAKSDGLRVEIVEPSDGQESGNGTSLVHAI